MVTLSPDRCESCYGAESANFRFDQFTFLAAHFQASCNLPFNDT